MFRTQACMLANALQRVLPTTLARHRLAILTCVLIEPDPSQPNRVRLRTSTVETGSETTLAVVRDADEIPPTTAPAKLLYELAGAFEDGTVLTIISEPKRCVIRTSYCRYELHGEHAHEFPIFPEIANPVVQGMLTASKLPALPKEKKKQPQFVPLHKFIPNAPVVWFPAETYMLLVRDLKQSGHARFALLPNRQFIWATSTVRRHALLAEEPHH